MTNPSPFVFGASDFNNTPAPTTTTLTLSPASVDSSGSVTFQVTSQAASNQNGCFIGSGLANLFANGLPVGFVRLGCNLVNGVVTVSGSATIPASELPAGTYSVVAEYFGDGLQLSSFSAPVQLTVAVTDFGLYAVGKNPIVSAGKSLTVPISMSSPSSSAITVALSCATSSASIVCSIDPASASVQGTGNATLTINAFVSPATTSARKDTPATGNTRQLERQAGLAFAFLIVVAVPGRKRAAKLWILAMLFAAFSVTGGCGGGSSSPASTASNPSAPAVTAAPAGSYAVTVTGVSNGITHSSTVNLEVQ
jgi:hypothetical protein